MSYSGVELWRTKLRGGEGGHGFVFIFLLVSFLGGLGSEEGSLFQFRGREGGVISIGEDWTLSACLVFRWYFRELRELLKVAME